jgi:hypothetical protein
MTHKCHLGLTHVSDGPIKSCHGPREREEEGLRGRERERVVVLLQERGRKRQERENLGKFKEANGFLKK